MYRHILAAVETDDEGQAVLTRARNLARQFGARLSMVHVVEYLPVPVGDGFLPMADLSSEDAAQAEARLKDWCRQFEIPVEQARVAFGAVTTEILRAAAEGGADLIVVGHHPRSGLAALFGHTEGGVVQRSPCDVLAVRLDPEAAT